MYSDGQTFDRNNLGPVSQNVFLGEVYFSFFPHIYTSNSFCIFVQLIKNAVFGYHKKIENLMNCPAVVR